MKVFQKIILFFVLIDFAKADPKTKNSLQCVLVPLPELGMPNTHRLFEEAGFFIRDAGGGYAVKKNEKAPSDFKHIGIVFMNKGIYETLPDKKDQQLIILNLMKKALLDDEVTIWYLVKLHASDYELVGAYSKASPLGRIDE